MRIVFTASTDNPCISFGYAGLKFREQLARLVDLWPIPELGPVEADLHIHLGVPAGKPDPYPVGRFWICPPRYAPRYIWYTVCEHTLLDPAWVAQFNASEALLTPSKFCCDVFHRNEVRVPIHIVPHGVDPADYYYLDRPQRKTYVFFWQGTSLLADRKCGYLVEWAFRELNLPDARLVLKTIPWPGGAMDVRIGKIHQIASWASIEAIRALDYEADCFVWPTRAEGFGMIPLEKMATGLPCIVTHFSGPVDYLRDDVAISLRKFEMQDNIYGPERGHDARVDMEELKQKMLWCYEHREEAAEIGRAASFYVRNSWTWDGRVFHALQDALKALHIPIKEPHARAA